MKCKICGKEISEDEIFCEECKEAMSNNSNEEEVKELESLIEEQSDLEITKPLNNISDLEEKESDPVILDENKNNKKTIIIVCVIALVLIITIILILLLTKDKKVTETKTIDYKKILNNYGDILSTEASKFIKENNNIPSFQKLNELANYEYSIECDVHEIYEDGSIYLDSCKINDTEVEYKYGEKKEIIKEGTTINVYINDGEYTNLEAKGNKEVGKITCEGECTFKIAFNNYVVVQEEDGFLYLYNYKTNTKEFGPFDNYSKYDIDERFVHIDNELYAIIYEENNKNTVYSLVSNKVFKDIEGTYLGIKEDDSDIEKIKLAIKYGYIMFQNSDGDTNLVSLKNGKIIKTFSWLHQTIEDKKDKLLYLVFLVQENDKNYYEFYNSNNKKLFDKEKIINYIIVNGKYIINSSNKIKVYDNNFKLSYSSKQYSDIKLLYENFAVVIDNNHLKIVDFNNNDLFIFEDEWDNDKYDIETYNVKFENNIFELPVYNDETGDTKLIKYNFNDGTVEIL